jgi:hypothetical protein
VSVEQNASGDYVIGVAVDGVFVPFLTKNRAYIETRVQKAQAAKAAAASTAKADE